MAGEEAIVHERLVSVTSAGAGELAANNGDEHESIVGWGCYPNNEAYYSISLLPSIAFAIVISSAYSRSAPTGKPNAIREIFTPKGFINLFK